MKMLMELWAYSPGEVAVMGAITVFCGLALAVILIALLSPTLGEEDEVIEG